MTKILVFIVCCFIYWTQVLGGRGFLCSETQRWRCRNCITIITIIYHYYFLPGENPWWLENNKKKLLLFIIIIYYSTLHYITLL